MIPTLGEMKNDKGQIYTFFKYQKENMFLVHLKELFLFFLRTIPCDCAGSPVMNLKMKLRACEIISEYFI